MLHSSSSSYFFVTVGRHTGSLDVSDDRTGRILEEFDADLGDTTARACGLPLAFLFSGHPDGHGALLLRTGSAQDAGDLDELDGLLIHFRTWFRRMGSVMD